MKNATIFMTGLFLILWVSAIAQQDKSVNILSGGREPTFDMHLPSDKPMQNL